MTLSDGWPPFYAERKTSAGVDVNQLYVAFVASALTFALLLILPGVRGLERSYFLLRWSVTLLVGALIIACGQGISWQVAEINADFRHKVNEENITNFRLGVMIGLNKFNVTLEGLREKNINLNEQFTFLTVDDTIFDSLQRGLPFPILTVAEHFSSVRFHSLWPWGRKYWMAGHYASYLLWTALACWGLTNVLFHMALQHGSVFMILTGILLLCTNISFATVNAGEQLVITLGYKDPSDRLILAFGWCFWSCLFVGFSCVVLGTIAYILEKVNKSYLEKFFMLRDNQDKQEDDDIELDYNISKSSEPSTPIRGILKSSSSSGEVNPSFVMETIDESTSRKRSTVTISDSADEVFAGKDSKRFKFKKVEEVL
ncbi:dual oxidase maturation factor 1-like isoform X1 [Styela clava]|nr:dual oxidase maturation factor 1-like isoform X2 [Styela clava]XP_039267425.1 dual oxidase maturation factor 1-like isoform X2 [Styela clava]XP_039267426.1 dual oxidase maturation factor 1-like isoform X2 [Styela clava]XP_039267427.1 dual oxidase maturation factor 1-like isoform X2 [Styela clava]